VKAPLSEVESQLEHAVASYVRERRVPGATAGVVLGDELAWSLPYGFTELETGVPAGRHTLYRVASITKTFTGAAVVLLRDEGRLHLDDPLVAHLSEFAAATNPYGPIEEVTIRRLLTHESGLPVESPLFDWAGRGYPPMPDILASLDDVVLPVPPDSAFKYSNLGYQLLGELVARLAEIPYEAFVEERLLGPLGMDSSTFAPDDEQRARAARGHDARTFSDHLAPSVERSKATSADGGLYSTVEDLAHWVSLQFRTGEERPDGSQILSARSLAEMHRPRRVLDPSWTRAQALAWQVSRRGTEVVVGHSGGTFGFSSCVAFSSREPVGVVVLSNGTAPASALALDLLEYALEAVHSLGAGTAVLPAPVPAHYRALLGLYAWEDAGAWVRVEWRDGSLVLVWSEEEESMQTQILEPTDDPLRFVVRGGREAGEACVFRPSSDGAIVGLTVRGWPLARLLPANP
jgi:CubicO group peptidase (beta-lactamase class C family)